MTIEGQGVVSRRAGEPALMEDILLDPPGPGEVLIRLAAAGIIGCVTISGLPQRQDHAIVVEALCAHLGLDHAALALPAE